MKKRLFLGLLILAVLFMAGTQVFAAGTQEVKPLNFALSGNPDTLDPHKTSGTLTFQVLKSIYDTLVEPDTTGKIVPALAESWTVTPDGLTWTFKLRKGVVFHDGQAFTSKDVKATFDRIRSEATASPKRSEFASIKEITTPDDLTVVIALSKPYAPFLATLASGWGAILPASLIESGHNFASAPVGTGPFKLTEWVRDNKIVLAKNTQYWMKGLPKLESIILHVIPERAVQVQGLLSGQIDALEFLDHEDLPILEANPDVVIHKELTSMILVMAMNCSKPPLNDLRVRQAVNHAVDKQLVLDVAYGGGKPVATFMDAGNAYYKDFTDLYPYNPDKAKALLKEAGIGQDTVLTIYLPQNYDLHVKAGELYQEMLTKVGLNVKIQLVDWSTWLSEVYSKGNYDFTVIGHTGKLDPDGTLAGYGEGKYVKWMNARAAEVIKQAVGVSDFAARKKLYDEALELMAREVPFVFLGSSYRYRGVRKNVIDFRMTPNIDTFDFRWTELK